MITSFAPGVISSFSPRPASSFFHPLQLQVDDHRDVLLRKRVEHDNVVHTVQEFGPEGLPQHI